MISVKLSASNQSLFQVQKGLYKRMNMHTPLIHLEAILQESIHSNKGMGVVNSFELSSCIDLSEFVDL